MMRVILKVDFQSLMLNSSPTFSW